MVLGETVLWGVGCTGWNSNGSRPYVGGGKQVSLSRGGERGRGMNRAPPPLQSCLQGLPKPPFTLSTALQTRSGHPAAHSGFQARERKSPAPLSRLPACGFRPCHLLTPCAHFLLLFSILRPLRLFARSPNAPKLWRLTLAEPRAGS